MISIKKNIALLILVSLGIVTISIEASNKGKSTAPAKPKPAPKKPKYTIPDKPGPINFVTPGPGDRTHPRFPRGRK